MDIKGFEECFLKNVKIMLFINYFPISAAPPARTIPVLPRRRYQANKANSDNNYINQFDQASLFKVSDSALDFSQLA